MRPDSATVDDFIATVDYWFCSDPPSHLECVICHSILKNPVCCDSGKHTFCLECVLKWQEKQPVSYAMTTQCPIDRGGLGDGYQGLRRPPLLVQECIDTLRVRCSLGQSRDIFSCGEQPFILTLLSMLSQLAAGLVNFRNGAIISYRNAR